MSGKPILQNLALDNINPYILIAAGVLVLTLVAVLFFAGDASPQKNEASLNRARNAINQVSGVVHNFHMSLKDQHVQELAVSALVDPDKFSSLQQYVSGVIPGVTAIELFGTDLYSLRAADFEPFGYALLDMLFTAEETGLAPAQLHGKGADAYLTMAVRLGEESSPAGYMLVKADADILISAFSGALPEAGAFALDQYNGQAKPTVISDFSVGPGASERVVWLRIPSALFRVGIIQSVGAPTSLGIVRPILFVLGQLMLVLGVMLKIHPHKPPLELEEDPEIPEEPLEDSPQAMTAVPDEFLQDPGNDMDDGLGNIELPDFGINLEKINMPHIKAHAPVELVESIFRAYDIRGVVGETLDADVARQVGQVVGSLAIEHDAVPVVVARDGRVSGPDLVAGMIEGISSTGCDVVDIGSVPTGVLYFAAYELGSATGVMVTGSHNPPDYNGFKILVGGVTLAGDQITDMYTRIQNGNLRVGRGDVTQKDMLDSYRERISGDIQLQRPLKVVADCGNGIGGICAADVLRGIGAEVLPLFDEVDGTFPNHHPDPSDPENLAELIAAVRMMDADIGIAFDGDADRLGVVTSTGEIIYSDRLMMLFAKDVLSRMPGSIIIYDVKCTGHLHHVIEQAGGRPMMYKTGHSLIKNKMREVNAPFAGEMSGHFFFKERWYGFDCGIYSAARLLEILATDERDPRELLNSLPNSVSTPELKVHMKEGENHAFVAELLHRARFVDANITTIDGVRADFIDGWGLVRASNTTPILVCRFDADNEESLVRIKEVFRQQMLAINDQLELPF